MKSESIIGAVCGAVFKIIVVIAVVCIIYNGATKCYDYGYRIFTEPPVSAGEGRTVEVTVTNDMSATDIGKLFEEKGLTRDSKLFALQYIFSEHKKNVVPGTFELNTSMTAEEMMAAMVAPPTDETAN